MRLSDDERWVAAAIAATLIFCIGVQVGHFMCSAV